ncbi:MAG: conjugal transfer protein [Methanosphaera sp. rholeuAM270]|nr:MAG: conjugal transfer protein [Methanosphaera sp. rholeuAM270]
MKNVVIENIDKIHTTPMGIERIKKNLSIEDEDVVEYCKKIVKNENSIVTKKGKNYYVILEDTELTINSSSFTIITAHIK